MDKKKMISIIIKNNKDGVPQMGDEDVEEVEEVKEEEDASVCKCPSCGCELSLKAK